MAIRKTLPEIAINNAKRAFWTCSRITASFYSYKYSLYKNLVNVNVSLPVVMVKKEKSSNQTNPKEKYSNWPKSKFFGGQGSTEDINATFMVFVLVSQTDNIHPRWYSLYHIDYMVRWTLAKLVFSLSIKLARFHKTRSPTYQESPNIHNNDMFHICTILELSFELTCSMLSLWYFPSFPCLILLIMVHSILFGKIQYFCCLTLEP